MDTFNDTLLSISTKLLDCPTAQMQSVIYDVIEQCRELLSVDRISCLPISEIANIYEAVGEGVPRVKRQLPLSVVLEYREIIKQGKVVDSDTSPSLHKLVSKIQDEVPLRHVLVPIRAMGKPWGCLACANFSSSTQFDDRFIELATILGNLLASSIERFNHYQELKQSRQTILERNKRIIGERERERQNIARDLHDDFTQRLASLGIELGLAYNLCDEQSKPVIQTCAKTLASITKDLQQLSRHLHPIVIERVGLAQAIESHVTQITERSGIQARFNLDTTVIIEPESALQIYRVVQEAVSNIIKHAKASMVEVNLGLCHHTITVTIRDNGVGIPNQAITTATPSLGLQSMIERGELIGAKVTIQPNHPHTGTTVELTMKNEEA